MLIELVQLKDTTADEPDEEYDEDLHDVNAIIMDICNALGDTHAFEFRVSGFGDARWPVDVATDLATLLEQLPRSLSALKNGTAFQIDFFEQGVQRRLEFQPNGASYDVACRSGTDWNPDPAEERIPLTALDEMLRALGREFVSLTRKLLPDLAAHPWFAAYAADIVA